MRWVDKYKSTNNITRKKRDYTSYKITNSHISFIKQQLKDFLCCKLKTPYNSIDLAKNIDEITDWWKNRWAKQRIEHLIKENRVLTLDKVIKDYNLII